MFKHEGGTRVRCGYYWSPARWEIVTITKGGGLLPGGREQGYLRLPIALLLLLAPLMGGLYVVFLPFIGFFMVLRLAGRRAAEALQGGFAEVMATLSPAWRPGEAYFAGKRTARGREEKGEKAEAPPAGEDDRLQSLQREIESKREARHE